MFFVISESSSMIKMYIIWWRVRSRDSIDHVEFCKNGSLDSYVKKNEATLTQTILLKMARDTAAGMQYLASAGFIHRYEILYEWLM